MTEGLTVVPVDAELFEKVIRVRETGGITDPVGGPRDHLYIRIGCVGCNGCKNNVYLGYQGSDDALREAAQAAEQRAQEIGPNITIEALQPGGMRFSTLGSREQGVCDMQGQKDLMETEE